MRTRSPVHVTMLLVAVVALGGCGKSSGLLSSGSAADLQQSLQQAESAYAGGDCSGARQAAGDGLDAVRALPSTVDGALRDRLQSGFRKLQNRIADCTPKPTTTEAAPPTTTETTPTETTPTTTESTTTEPTTTDTTPTDTDTTPSDGGLTVPDGGDSGGGVEPGQGGPGGAAGPGGGTGPGAANRGAADRAAKQAAKGRREAERRVRRAIGRLGGPR